MTNCELRTLDNAVALGQTYLRLNGYFTVAEYPMVAFGLIFIWDALSLGWK